MMKFRWLWFWLCIVLGLVLLAAGLLIPAHLRALDIGVVQMGGKHSGSSLLERGKTLADAGRLGAAELYAPAAQEAGMAGWDRFGATITNQIRTSPALQFWGNDVQTPVLFNKTPLPDSFASFIVRAENREAALGYLSRSSSSAVQELLHTRQLSSLALFVPSTEPGGQVYDTAVAETGLLLDGGHVTTSLNDNILALALQANRGNGSQPLEEVLEDFVSLSERLNWDQLRAFAAEIPDAAALHRLAAATRAANGRLPLLFAAVDLSGDPAAVGKYLEKFPDSGLQDMAEALCYGGDGVKALAERGERFYDPKWLGPVVQRDPFGAFYYFAAKGSLAHPRLMLAVKWFLYLLSGFFFALALHASRPMVSDLEKPLEVRGVHLLRGLLFALGFLLMVVLLSEPFLAREQHPEAMNFRLHLPMAGGAVSAGLTGIKQSIMNPTILLTLLLFFVLQSLIYLACLLKLAEIRRQQAPPRTKLKLLENEEHLFDAGLYLGFVGTIVSLIVASLGLVHFSLMAAYSSTSFGIIYVCIFKIFHLRPARRALLLEAEAEYVPPTAP